MTGGGPPGGRNAGFGGDEAALSPFTTARPIPGTVVRRDNLGNIQTLGLIIVEGRLQFGEASFTFPLEIPDPDTFLHHIADGELEWIPVSTNGGGDGGPIPWLRIVGTPNTLAGYGISDAFTKIEIQTLFANIQFDDTGFGQPIGGIAARNQLPATVAYEDEPNTFGPRQTIPDLEATNFEALLRFIGSSQR